MPITHHHTYTHHHPTDRPPLSPTNPNRRRHLPPLRGGEPRRRHDDTDPRWNDSCPGHGKGEDGGISPPCGHPASGDTT